MRKIIYYIVFVCFSIFIIGCFEEDERIIPIQIEEIDIPYSMYEYQTYYSISDQSIVSYHHFSDWDLGFESSEAGYRIILNYSRFMYAGNTFSNDFYSVVNPIENMKFDHSNGNMDSTVLVNWADYSNLNNPIFSEYVYIVDRGKDESGGDYGLKKVVFEKLEADTFYIHYANLDNTEEHSYKIPKNPAVNFVLFSFDEGGQIVVQEPDKSTWDICFTKYSTVIPDNNGVPTDYLVRGVYSNPYKQIDVGIDTINYYYDINKDLLDSYDYFNDQDAIGYEWKVFNNSVYEVIDYHTYILKSIDGESYKLRFTRFYNEQGVKGYPSFELTQF